MIIHADTRIEVCNTPYKCKIGLQTATYNIRIGYYKLMYLNNLDSVIDTLDPDN